MNTHPQQHQHEIEQPFDKNAVERNRSGSPFVELDLKSDDTAQRLGAYYIDLQGRHNHWIETKAPWTAPERRPSQTEVELKLLETLVRQGGKVNLWDVSIDLMNPNRSLSIGFDEGCDSFISRLELEVQQEQ